MSGLASPGFEARYTSLQRQIGEVNKEFVKKYDKGFRQNELMGTLLIEREKMLTEEFEIWDEHKDNLRAESRIWLYEQSNRVPGRVQKWDEIINFHQGRIEGLAVESTRLRDDRRQKWVQWMVVVEQEYMYLLEKMQKLDGTELKESRERLAWLAEMIEDQSGKLHETAYADGKAWALETF